MNTRTLTDSSRPELVRGGTCVIVLAAPRADPQETLRCALAAVREGDAVVLAGARPPDGLGDELDGEVWYAGDGGAAAPASGEQTSSSLVSRVLALCAPADVVLVQAPCPLPGGWLRALQLTARAESGIASASALTTGSGPLAVLRPRSPEPSSRALHPGLRTIELPCALVRREALELVGTLDVTLELQAALRDLARRCLLAGLSHVAADDVVASRESPAGASSVQTGEDAGGRVEPTDAAVSPLLVPALRRAGSEAPLTVTLDVRDLGSPMTGTRRHAFELARALAATGDLRLRALVSGDTGAEAMAALGALPGTEVVAVEDLAESARCDDVFHRPQQMSHAGDLELALRLGERLVLSQLDLIAFRNPGYHADAVAWEGYRHVNALALAAASRVLVLSRYIAAELMAEGLAPHERVRLVAPGLDHLRAVEAPGAAGPPPADLPAWLGEEPFLLCLGADYMHKNRLFALRLLGALRARGWHGRLVLAGAHVENGSSRELEREYLVRHPDLEGVVTELGAVGEPQREWLTVHARALLYPSVSEGFGLVPLEAAAVGIPCIYAARTSLAEIMPEAATIVPWDAAASAAASSKLLEPGAERSLHVTKLAKLAEDHTWADAARATIDVYREAVEHPACEAAMPVREAMHAQRELHEIASALASVKDERDRAVAGHRAAHDAYVALKEEVGFAAGLVGPSGALPEDIQRALLAATRLPLFGTFVLAPLATAVRFARVLARLLRHRSGR